MTVPLPDDDGRNGCIQDCLDEPPVPETPVPFYTLCAHLHDRIQAFLAEKPATARARAVQEQTRISLGVIGEALDRYALPELSLSYNGGKDCLVLLILYLSALHSKGLTARPWRPSHTANGTANGTTANGTLSSPVRLLHDPIQCVYIQAAHPFPEVEAFVASNELTYSLSLARYAKPMKVAFADYLHDFPQVKAIFVGTRRTDPHGQHLKHFDPTDHGWPDFMRVHPVIDWHYVDIWTFIRHLRIPYCPLYDLGYTSLGGTTDTHPNPALRRKSERENGCSPPYFRPAYELVEDGEERLGRDS